MPRSEIHILSEYLVLEAQSGNEQAIGKLVEIWSDPLSRRARHLLADPEAARDATQEAWVGIARSIRSLKDPARFGPWALRIVHHKCADEIRRRVRDRQHSRTHKNSKQSGSDEDGVQDERAAVREAICTLPTKYREVIMLFYMDDCPTDIIAIVLDIPVSTVKTRLRRARAQLKPLLERIDSNG